MRLSLCVLFAVSACSEDPSLFAADPLAIPTTGSLVLTAPDPVYLRETNTFTVSGAGAGETVFLARGGGGIGDGRCPPSLGRGCLDIVGPLTVEATMTADATGEATVALEVPGGPSGVLYGLQAVAIRGVDGSDTVFSEAVEIQTLARDTDGDGDPDVFDPCPVDPGNDSDGDGSCDSDDLCPGFDDLEDTNGNGEPDGCETLVSCAGILTANPAATDGVYAVDPLETGSPFDVYCDMTGGGWTLVMHRTNGVIPTETSDLIDPSSANAAMHTDRWVALRDRSTEARATSPSTNRYADLSVLMSANCIPLGDSLDVPCLAHNETSGCGGSGGDYSNWFGHLSIVSHATYFVDGSNLDMYSGSAAWVFEPQATMWVR